MPEANNERTDCKNVPDLGLAKEERRAMCLTTAMCFHLLSSFVSKRSGTSLQLVLSSFASPRSGTSLQSVLSSFVTLILCLILDWQKMKTLTAGMCVTLGWQKINAPSAGMWLILGRPLAYTRAELHFQIYHNGPNDPKGNEI